jgi:general secretion pathway protein B
MIWTALAVLVVGGAIAAAWLWRAPSVDERVDGNAHLRSMPGVPAAEVAAGPIVATAPQAGVSVLQAAVPAPAPAAIAAPPEAVVPRGKPTADVPALQVKAPGEGKPEAASKSATPVGVAPAVVAATPLLSELPEEIRRQISALAISGAVYSEYPGQRMLLVNGQVLKQGSAAGPDLTLEEIRASSSVFNFRGTRFRVTH